MYAELLEDEGYKTEKVFNGEMALNKLINNYYDFVYLGILMPKKDGIQVLKEFKATGKKQGKIVFFTNVASPEVINLAFNVGADGYEILSNVTPEASLEKIKKYINSEISKEQSKREVLSEKILTKTFERIKTVSTPSIDYGLWGILTGAVVFICIWIYAISEWGLLIGLMFGWIPALIGGFILGVLWPIVAILILLVIGYLLLH